MRPGKLDLAGGRWVPFEQIVRLRGINLTGATFAMQVRLTPDADGAALITLGTVGQSPPDPGVAILYAGSATIDAHIAAGRLDAIPDGSVGTDTLALTTLTIRIAETTMEAMPFPGEVGTDAEFAWDLHITPSGGLKQKWLGGIFTVEAGVTR